MEQVGGSTVPGRPLSRFQESGRVICHFSSSSRAADDADTRADGARVGVGLCVCWAEQSRNWEIAQPASCRAFIAKARGGDPVSPP